VKSRFFNKYPVDSYLEDIMFAISGGAMERSSHQSRRPFKFSNSTNRRLDMYALAATAAGVGALASPQAAEARIVYTPKHVQVQRDKPYPIDLDHNGRVDFLLLNSGPFGPQDLVRELSVCEFVAHTVDSGYVCTVGREEPNAVVVAEDRSAAALSAGVTIQRKNVFSKGDFGVKMGRVTYFSTTPGTSWFGPWMNGGKGVRNRYLGLKFGIDGKVHFGWARLTVTTEGKDFTAILTGYAYETIPGKGITAGQTTESDEPEESLGSLALGRK
jgi:hypothetical protein